jgi:phosphoribosyl 1,2-cyclic phosphodiesterase
MIVNNGLEQKRPTKFSGFQRLHWKYGFFTNRDDIVGTTGDEGPELVQSEMSVRFWGVRGSIACPGPETVRYGGNTSCVEVRCGKHLLVFDAGTGLRLLGRALLAEGHKVSLDLYFSHTHLDHIDGMPFFAPLHAEGNHVRIWAGHLKPHHTVKGVLDKMMSAPLFPVPVEIFKAKTEFYDFTVGETLTPHPGIKVVTAPLNHPNGATGYRVEYQGKTVAYITDNEHRPGETDATVLGLMRGADIAIYDCTYEEAEFPSRKGWGHSTWEEGVRLAALAGVKTFVIFHHDPDHDDAHMDEIARKAAALRPGTLVAQEGMVLTP